jgi:RNA-binding protein
MMTSKQRSYLRALASKIDTSLIIGKTGISETVVQQAANGLKANELIKGRVLKDSSSLTATEAGNTLAQRTDSELVTTIGSRFVLYKRNEDKPKIILPEQRG